METQNLNKFCKGGIMKGLRDKRRSTKWNGKTGGRGNSQGFENLPFDYVR